MKQWRAPRDYRSSVALVGALVLLALAAGGAARLLPLARLPVEEWPIGLDVLALAVGVLLALLGAGALVWQAIKHASLHYTLDRNAVTVLRGGSRYTIPLDRIIAVAEVPTAPPDRTTMRFGRGGRDQTLALETPQRRYLLALIEREAFARELRERQPLGVVQPQSEGLHRSWQALHTFWEAPAVRALLVLTVVLNVGVWSLLAWRYALLPDTVPLRFDPLGGTQGTRPRTSTLLLPLIASGMWLGNTALAVWGYRRVRLASELLLLGALIVQLMSLAAVWFIIGVAQVP